MRRRDFLGTLVGGASAWPLVVRAQKAPLRVGFLSAGSPGSAFSVYANDAIKQALADGGLVEARDYVFEVRYAAGDYERFPELASELVQAGATVILTNTIASVRAAQRLSPPVRIVMISVNNPVGNGLVASLARPGGNITGMATLAEDLTSKLLDLVRELLPAPKSVAALFNPLNPSNPVLVDNLRKAAGAIDMTVLPVELKSAAMLEDAFSAISAGHPDVLVLVPDLGTTIDLGDRIAALALARKLPSLAIIPEYTRFGGLIAYGVSSHYLFAKSAYFLKRIFDGANPAELPVEQPTQIELAVNLKIAKALGLAVPPSLLARADTVVED